MEKIFTIGRILRVLRWIFIALIAITLIVFTGQMYEMVCWWKSHSLGELAANPLFLKYLLVGSFSILTLYIAANQLQKQANTAMVTALTELRKQLTSDRNRKMHFMLSPREEQRTLADTGYTVEKTKILTIDAFNYLGTLELGILIIPTLTGFKTLLG